MEKLTMTVQEAGEALGLSRNSAYEACKTGAIPTLIIGRRILVPRAQLEAMLRGEKQPALTGVEA
ncbi:MAG: helix-turn-helix domain-containing protein [Chloroflexi bacterium]|nr:helix-turn-helix domain-containing protein [Chloroflexota bacterium]